MIERASLFTKKRDALIFGLFLLLILSISLLIEYKNYKELIRFDSALVDVTLLKQYTKSKNSRTYQVLKLKSSDGLIFYTTANRSLQDLSDKKIKLEIWPKEITFYGYLTNFYAKNKILKIEPNNSIKESLNHYLLASHEDKSIATIYKALYSASPVDQEVQNIFSNLGISHLIAISGFHLGVLSTLLYFIIKPIYRFFQNKFFPYRNSKVDIFILVAVALFTYMLFLESPPSLVRSFGMFMVGFILYDRGMKILSMQTLIVTILLLLAFFPRLFFSLGFWLSSSGVFYIFLFLIHFKRLNIYLQMIGISIFVYLAMLPISLYIFQNFSLYHPLSIIISLLFTPFYPLSIALHIIGFGDLFDTFLLSLMSLGKEGIKTQLSVYLFALHFLISFIAIYSRVALWTLMLFCSSIFIYAIYQVT